jgi:hypothetical protein
VWATENVIVEFSEWVHGEIADYRLCVLIMDVDPSRRTERALATAEAENVEFLVILAGRTGRFQPMDRRIFGEMKARARADLARRLWREGSETVDHHTSVDILEKCSPSARSGHVQKPRNIV